jgi:ATP-binding cassette, subfamily B, bacterial
VRPHSAGGKRSLLRLWPYVRPVRVRLAAASLLAIVASCLGLAMPLVLKWLVDGPVSHRDPSGVWLGGLWLLLLGIAEAGIFGVRRWLAARPLAEVEAAMREDLYRHVQRLRCCRSSCCVPGSRAATPVPPGERRTSPAT